MSRGTRTRATRKPIVIIAGEDGNDRRSLRILLEAQCVEMRGRLVEINDSVRLRLATGENLVDRVATLGKKARARAAREKADLACVFVHEDLDSCHSADYDDVRGRVQDALDAEFGSAHYVLAAAEMEAWLLLFPEALTAFVSSWRVPSRYGGKDTGKIEDPKRVLRNDVSTSARRYSESDAPKIFEKVVGVDGVKTPRGSNQSWKQFCLDVEKCCAGHMGGFSSRGASPGP